MPRPSTPEDPEQVAAAEANYLAAWKLLVHMSPGGSVEETDEVLYTVVPAPIAYFNSAFVKPEVDPASCLETVKAFYAARDKPFTLRFRGSAAAAAACEDAALASAGQSPLMNVATAMVGPPAILDVRPVDASSWDDHLLTIAAGFGMPPKLVAGMFPPTLLEGDHYAAFNTYIEGDAVSTAALIVTDGIAGIYNVATIEDFRRRGLGEATTRAAVVEGRCRGCPIATLQSSQMGFRVYEGMGFQTVATWMSFTGSQQ